MRACDGSAGLFEGAVRLESVGQAIVRYGLVVVGWIGGMKFTAYLGGFPALSIIPGHPLASSPARASCPPGSSCGSAAIRAPTGVEADSPTSARDRSAATNARWCSARIPRAVSATMRSSLPPGRVGRLVTRCLRIIVRPGRGAILPSFATVLGRLGSLETEDTRQHGTPKSSIPVAMRGSVLTPARPVAQKRRGQPWWPP